MDKLYIIDLESIEQRYTKSWKNFIPEGFRKLNYDVEVISGDDNNDTNNPSKGGFLNFLETNKYKASQINKLVDIVPNASDNDIFLFVDAWHFGIIALKYMLGLTGKKCKVAGMWHAGSYSKNDPLNIPEIQEWSKSFEISIYECLDYNFFASQYHMDDFITKRIYNINRSKCFFTGFPFDFSYVEDYNVLPFNERKNVILFPHRNSKERNTYILTRLKNEFPDYEIIKTLDVTKTKEEFYELLSTSKFVFSYSDNENWGISIFEGLSLGCIPIVNNDFSYKEMYHREFRFNSFSGIKKMIYRDYSYVDFKFKMKHLKKNYCNGIENMVDIFQKGKND